MSTSTPGGGPAPEAGHETGDHSSDEARPAGGAPAPVPGSAPPEAVPPEARFPPEVVAALREYPECRPAAEFAAAFRPLSGVDYSFAADYARGQYENALKDFDGLDAKAGSLITAAGSGTGLLTAGSVLAAAGAVVHPLVIIAATPAVALAFAALLCAVRARATEAVFPPPPADGVLTWVNFDRGDAAVRGRLAAQWHLCTALLGPVLRRKAEYVESSTKYFAASITAFLLPLVLALGLKLFRG